MAKNRKEQIVEENNYEK
jgi:hypothetical protein